MSGAKIARPIGIAGSLVPPPSGSRDVAAGSSTGLPADAYVGSRGPKAIHPNPDAPQTSFWASLAAAVPLLQRAWNYSTGANGATLAAAKVPTIPGMIKPGSQIADLLQSLKVMPIVSRVLESGPFQAASRILELPALQVAGRVAGRLAPVLSVGFAAFDFYHAWNTQLDPKASSLRKELSWVQTGLMTVSAGASLATLPLAPTGVGALVAGGIAIATGLASAGVNMLMEHVAPR